MSLVKPFRGLRPAPGRAADVIAPPYDVVTTAEARALVQGRPWSFLHISRPEVDLDPNIDAYDPAVYAKARENFNHMRAESVLVRDEAPSYYVYRLNMGGHVQTGLVVAASVTAYDADRIKRHEHTRPAKEDDRVRQITALDAQTGPVFLVYRAESAIDERLAALADSPPEVDLVAADGVRHTIWPVADSEMVGELTDTFDRLDALYVADGHHRSAAASRVAATRHAQGLGGGDAFLAVVFPHDQMQILAYNRVVKDLGGLDTKGFLNALDESFESEPSSEPVSPASRGEFGLYIDGGWYRLRIREALRGGDDPVARLDVSLLQDRLIAPILGIDDPRRDPRIDFVGGIRGLRGLTERVDSLEWRAAFSLYPTAMEELMAVADAGTVMPPKSTWFEPKLADGLVSLVLD